MSIVSLTHALDRLWCEFAERAITDRREQITVELSYEAGMRFERWMALNAPPYLNL